MGKIRIINDGGGVYEYGEIIAVGDLIRDYCDCDNDKSMQDWLWKVPIPTAVKHIADMWGLEYEYVS